MKYKFKDHEFEIHDDISWLLPRCANTGMLVNLSLGNGKWLTAKFDEVKYVTKRDEQGFDVIEHIELFGSESNEKKPEHPQPQALGARPQSARGSCVLRYIEDSEEKFFDFFDAGASFMTIAPDKKLQLNEKTYTLKMTYLWIGEQRNFTMYGELFD